MLLGVSIPIGLHARDMLICSVADQKMVLIQDNEVKANYVVSTSKFGLGDQEGSCRTPLGRFRIYKKIGEGKPMGAVFKRRRWTGEIVRPNTPDRDPIVTRIIWLDGLERQNRRAASRGIYIHGTPEEATLGRATSYGCIRMRSKDIVGLYRKINESTEVVITRNNLHSELARLQIVEKQNLYASH